MWPQFLWLLLAIPLAGAGVHLAAATQEEAGTALRQPVHRQGGAGRRHAWRRHVPPVLFLLAIGAMLFAAARPFAVISLPSTQETIILAMDVSGSMRATDVKPNRLVASQEAAKAFLAELPRNVRVGIVAFAGTASVVQPPTLSREDLVAAIDKFQLQRATAIGSAIVVSLAEIVPGRRHRPGCAMTYGNGNRNARHVDRPGQAQEPQEGVRSGRRPARTTRPPSFCLTDGQRTTGVDTMEASQDGSRPGRACLHRRRRHGRRRDHRLRGLVDAGAAGRTHAQGGRARRPRPSISTPARPRI
jgi:Ca-activated chloride channel family protein